MDAGRDTADPDAAILALAARQHGVVSRSQLQRLGISAHRIEYRLRKGRLESLHAGVYRIGPLVAPRQRELAALLACGDDAVLSHQSAGALWELHSPPNGTPVVISTTRLVRLRSSAVRVHRMTTLHREDITQLDGLPLTTPSRTLLDLAGSLGTRELEQALARASRQGRLMRDQIQKLLERYPRRHGIARLRTLLSAPDDPVFTRSEAEERFLALVRRAGLRPPEMNVKVRGFEVDALWRAERLVVEIDGFAYHSSPMDFERDRYRDGVLTAAGFRVMRIIWHQLTREPEALLIRLGQALVSGGVP
jgi:very-short-patch-repair endonuclease